MVNETFGVHFEHRGVNLVGQPFHGGNKYRSLRYVPPQRVLPWTCTGRVHADDSTAKRRDKQEWSTDRSGYRAEVGVGRNGAGRSATADPEAVLTALAIAFASSVHSETVTIVTGKLLCI